MNFENIKRKLLKLKKEPRQFIADSEKITIAGHHINSSKIAVVELNYKPWLVLPSLVVLIYFFVIASNQYESSTIFLVKNSEEKLSAAAQIPILGVDSSKTQDAHLVKQYILSRDMLLSLQRDLSIKQHYSNSAIDTISRLSSDATIEEFHRYYLSKVEVQFDEISSLITLKVRSFSPEFSHLVVSKLVAESEQFINQLGHRLAYEEVSFVESELDKAHEKLRLANESLLDFQAKNKVYSAEQYSTAMLQVMSELKADLIKKETELEVILSYMNENTAEVKTLKSQISALKSQLALQNQELVDKSSGGFNELDLEFRSLQMQIEFASDVYKATLLGLEQTRVEAHRKLKHLQLVASPSKAEQSEYPRRWYWSLTICLGFVLVYSSLVMIQATIKEHRE